MNTGLHNCGEEPRTKKNASSTNCLDNLRVCTRANCHLQIAAGVKPTTHTNKTSAAAEPLGKDSILRKVNATPGTPKPKKPKKKPKGTSGVSGAKNCFTMLCVLVSTRASNGSCLEAKGAFVSSSGF